MRRLSDALITWVSGVLPLDIRKPGGVLQAGASLLEAETILLSLHVLPRSRATSSSRVVNPRWLITLIVSGISL